MNIKLMQNWIEIAGGRQIAELVIKNGYVVNVISKEIIKADVAINDGFIVGVGEYNGINEIDAEDQYICPGLIDGHVHIESSLVAPIEFSKAILKHGTTTIIADPHEIANVCGTEGIDYMIAQAAAAPLDVFFMAPSCVPRLRDIAVYESLLKNDRVLGLGEVMDYNAVINGYESVLEKIVVFKDKIIDGHAPGLQGKDLNAYCVSGIVTDHECCNATEALEKIRLGMYILIREGSAAKNLKDIIEGLLMTGTGFDRCLLCTDDRHLDDIKKEGHIDNNVRSAIKLGLDPIEAIRMATFNTSQCYNLKNIGAIAPGNYADILILNDLEEFELDKVLFRGKQIDRIEAKGRAGKLSGADKHVINTVHVKKIGLEDLLLPLKEEETSIIQIEARQITTKRKITKVNSKEGFFIADRQYAKLAVIDRHNAADQIGIGIVEGFGIANGAIGSTVSHDTHNLIIAGDNDKDIMLVIKELVRAQGGFAVVSDGKVIDTLALPIAGLMSSLDAKSVEINVKRITKSALSLCNSKGIDPFMALSFLSLIVIPEIRLTEKGLYDVSEGSYIK